MIYFLVFLFLEIATSSFFSDILGFFLTFVWIILSIIIGIFLLKNFNLVVMYNVSEIMKGNLSKEEFYKNNIAKLVGALLLIIPGFFTDILGILFFSGILNPIFMKVINNKFNKNNTNYDKYNANFFYTNAKDKNSPTKNVSLHFCLNSEVFLFSFLNSL